MHNESKDTILTLNPGALVFWLIAAGIGYLIADTGKGAIVGAVCAMTFSLAVSFLEAWRNR